jgi:DNA-binding NtrC family response regulator
LATCYGIITQLGGRIDVASELGCGSVFTLYLPVAETVVQEAIKAPAAAPPDAGTETILLVEDDAGLRSLAKTVLEAGGYLVLDARFGEEALWVADRHEGQIDLLLTDGVMPIMSGAELAKRFTRFHPETKIIYMSGYEREAALEEEATRTGSFLAKPFTPDELLDKVEATLAPD